MFTENEITEIVTSQLHSLIWSEGEITDENGDYTLENWEDFYSPEDATPELVAQLTEELTGDLPIPNAIREYRKHFGDVWAESFGHDLALTRNGHGVGFGDRGLGEDGAVLSDWAHSLGTLHIFHGHDSIHPEKWAGMFHAE